MQLAGLGHNVLWIALPTAFTMAGGFFLLAFSIRKVGRIEYGAMVTITSAASILTMMFLGLRYSVTRSAASAASLGVIVEDGTEAEAVRTAHSLFVFGALGLTLIGGGVAWLIPLDLGIRGPMAFQIYLACIIAIVGSAVTLAMTAYGGILTSQEMFARTGKIGLLGFACQTALTLTLAGPLRVVGLAIAGLGSALLQGLLFYFFGRKSAPWMRLWPRWPKAATVSPVLRYASGIALLSATSTICAASDAFILGLFGGGGFVTVFRVGSIAPVGLVAVLYLSFGVLFPRLIRNPDPKIQEEGIGWLGGSIGWASGALFGALCLLGPDFVRFLYGRSDSTSVHILWICSAALCIDVSYHGVVQGIFARGQQGVMAKFTWVELVLNLSVTVLGVKLFGPLGSALALAITISATDFIGFPIIARGRWGSPPGRFVMKHGVLQSAVGGAIVLLIGFAPITFISGFLPHVLFTGLAMTISMLIGFFSLGASGRSRARLFFSSAS
jgi:O-antigen/teichoic acid export membrane protein